MTDDFKNLKLEYTYDGLHFNEEGYKILEKILEKEIFCIYLEEEKVKELDKNNKTTEKNKFDFNFTEYTFLKTELQNLEEILKKEENKKDCIYIKEKKWRLLMILN